MATQAGGSGAQLAAGVEVAAGGGAASAEPPGKGKKKEAGYKPKPKTPEELRYTLKKAIELDILDTKKYEKNKNSLTKRNKQLIKAENKKFNVDRKIKDVRR